MRIVIGSVVKGFTLKTTIKKYLEDAGHTVTDVGCADTSVFVKFPSVAERAAYAIQNGQADRGILCCGSGTGMALAVSKFKGICAVPVESPLAAEFARKVNNANVICMGESLVAADTAARIVQTFLDVKFQDAPAIPEHVRTFWAEALSEIAGRGDVAKNRELETLI